MRRRGQQRRGDAGAVAHDEGTRLAERAAQGLGVVHEGGVVEHREADAETRNRSLVHELGNDDVGQAAFSFNRTGCRRSEEHTSELQSLMRISYAVFCLKKKTTNITT